jgi:hypothetical protein
MFFQASTLHKGKIMAEGAQPLWHVNFKINHGRRGLNSKFHIAGGVEADVKVKAINIATRLRWIMPTSAEIAFASISKDNTKKDSRLIPGALGNGLSPEAAETPASSVPDLATTCLLIRMEHEDGGEVTRKIGPILDVFVEDAEAVAAITDVVGVPVADPAASAAGDTYQQRVNKLMQVLVRETAHVVSGHAPGGVYQTFAWQNAYFMRVGQKKGGRVFV